MTKVKDVWKGPGVLGVGKHLVKVGEEIPAALPAESFKTLKTKGKIGPPEAEDTPAEDTPAEDTPAEDTPAEDTPAEDTPAEDTPAEDTPAEDTPAAGPKKKSGKKKP